jgi:hypothetical protein
MALNSMVRGSNHGPVNVSEDEIRVAVNAPPNRGGDESLGRQDSSEQTEDSVMLYYFPSFTAW